MYTRMYTVPSTRPYAVCSKHNRRMRNQLNSKQSIARANPTIDETQLGRSNSITHEAPPTA